MPRKTDGSTNVFIFADPHIGINYPHRRDPDTGISARSNDVLEHFTTIINQAAEEGASFILCAGDFYNRTSGINPTIKRDLRNGPLKALSDASIQLRIVTGNHDAPASPRRGCDVEELEIYPNIHVNRLIRSEMIDVGGVSVAIVYLPYYSTSSLVDRYHENNPDEVIDPGSREQYAVNMITQAVKRELKKPEVQQAAVKILLGHYAISEAQESQARRYKILPGDLRLKQDEYCAGEFDLCAFGHIHKGQNLSSVALAGTSIIMAGSIDFVDWGEMFDGATKGYYTFNVATKALEFHEIQCRELKYNSIIVPDGTVDIAAYVTDHLLPVNDPSTAEIRASVEVPAGKANQVSSSLLNQVYPDAFLTEMYTRQRAQETGAVAPRDEILEPKALFLDYCSGLQLDEDLKAVVQREGELLIDAAEEQARPDNTTEEVTVESVELSYFNKYAEKQVVTFDKLTTAIAGPTGSGKTSIFDALAFGFYADKQVLRVEKAEDAFGPNGGEVRVTFMQGAKRWRVIRKYVKGGTDKPAKKASGKKSRSAKPDAGETGGAMKLISTLEWQEEDGSWQDFSGTKTAIDQKIEEILGLDWKGFTNSVFIPQGEIKNFSNTSAENIKTLERLFHLDIFETLQEQASQKLQAAEQEASVDEGRAEKLREIVHQLPTIQQDLGKTRQECKRSSELVKAARNEVAKGEAALEVLKPRRDEYLQKKQSIKDKQQQNNTIQQEISRLSIVQKTYREKQNERDALGENPKEDLLKARHDRDMIDETLKRQKGLVDQAASVKKRYELQDAKTKSQLEAKRKTINDKQLEKSQLPAEFDKDEAFNLLRNEGRFTERISRITEKEIPLANRLNDPELIAEFEAESRDTEVTLASVQAKTSLISPACFSLSDLNVRIAELEAEVEALEADAVIDWEQRDGELVGIEAELEQFEPNLNDKKAEFSNRIQELQVVVNQFEDLEQFFSQNADPTDLIADKTSTRELLAAEIEDLTLAVDALSKVNNKYTEDETKLANYRAEQTKLERNVATLTERVANYEKSMKDIEGYKIEIEELEASTAECQLLISGLKYLKENVFHAKGIPQYAINKWAGPLGVQAGIYLDSLTGGRFNQVQLETFSKGRQYGYRISVFDANRGFRPIYSFSGGEQTQINAALRFSVGKLLQRLRFSAPRFLFIDEGDLGSLDADDARRDFVSVLLEMGKEYRQLVLITHFPEVAEPFEAQYFVSIVDDMSRISRQV